MGQRKTGEVRTESEEAAAREIFEKDVVQGLPSNSEQGGYRGGQDSSEVAAAPIPQAAPVPDNEEGRVASDSTAGASALREDKSDAQGRERLAQRDLDYGEANLPNESEPSLFARVDPDAAEQLRSQSDIIAMLDERIGAEQQAVRGNETIGGTAAGAGRRAEVDATAALPLSGPATDSFDANTLSNSRSRPVKQKIAESPQTDPLSRVPIVRALKRSKVEAPAGKVASPSDDKELAGELQALNRTAEESASAPLPAPAAEAAKPAEELEGAERHRLKGILKNALKDQTAPQVGGKAGEPPQFGAGEAVSDGFTFYDTESAEIAGAQAFLARYSLLDGLTFQDPRGYWANTYIPGDPAIRLLEARWRQWDRAALSVPGRLEQAVRPVAQPFDAPQSAALALYLQSDAAAIEGPTRMRLQIGLKGAERDGGHRPAMNIGLVVDLRSVAKDGSGPRLTALVMALEQARQPGDRFSLIAAGPGGGVIVTPEDFRYGALRVALEQLFENRDERLGEAVSLPLAVSLATETVRQTDDPSAILGSSLVLLATDGGLAGDVPALENMAHANAVGGIPLSVVSLGGKTGLDEIDRLVAAGQGNRRVLESADQAEGLIDRELHSASRAVARALRLRVRLAPGVKLIDVLGSQKLEAPQAERVREAEQSLDRRLAQNLGIIADRGLDEEGIQIVIPSFYAGDSHVVLLDVIAENPGPIADVRVRYKDVVYLKNGVAEASLALDRGTAAQGPLERNVLKNLVTWEMVRELRQIVRNLEAGHTPIARLQMAQLRGRLIGLRREVPGWASDPDLAADQTMLDDYLAILLSPRSNDPALRRYLANSMQLAAFYKLQPRAE